MIADNGTAGNQGSDIGGVKVSSSMGGNVFDQNTVVHNRTRQIASDAAGVHCTVANFTASRNLITNNVRETSYEVQTQGACVFAQSFTEPGNGTNALKFVNPSQANYHLTAESPATVRDVAGVTNCSGVDIDGDARPQGTACDVGADEYKP